MATEADEGKDFTVPQAIELAIRAQRTGQPDAAEEIYRRVLAAWPECPDALHFSGLLAFQRGKKEEGMALVERSLKAAPEHPDFWNNCGNLLKSQGKKTGAAEAYRRAISLRANFADAHNNLGILLDLADDSAGAEKEYRAAIAVQPWHPDAHFNLALLLESQKHLDAACDAYAKVIAERPGDPIAYGRLAHIRWHQGRPQDAIEVLKRNVDINADAPEAWVLLAGILFDQKHVEESLEAYHRALALDPKNPNANRTLAFTLNLLGRKSDAAEVWRRWLDADPENPIPRHYLAAATGTAVPPRAEDSYVVKTFDRFASSFDEKLKFLDYRAPELTAAAVSREIGEPRAALDILDAGCGTGLCAPLLRPFARCLDGVDLSPGMLERAKERGGYDDLEAAELTAFLASVTAEYDLIVSADTLCYFGSLDAVTGAAANALRPGGTLIFTVEKHADAESSTGFTLDHTGRYTHTEAYVRAALSSAGFEVRTMEVVTLRTEYFKPVEGFVAVARKAQS